MESNQLNIFKFHSLVFYSKSTLHKKLQQSKSHAISKFILIIHQTTKFDEKKKTFLLI